MELTVIGYFQLYDYAVFSRYPNSSLKNQLHNIRRKCIEYFRTEDGVLYYSTVGTSKVSKFTTEDLLLLQG